MASNKSDLQEQLAKVKWHLNLLKAANASRLEDIRNSADRVLKRMAPTNRDSKTSVVSQDTSAGDSSTSSAVLVARIKVLANQALGFNVVDPEDVELRDEDGKKLPLPPSYGNWCIRKAGDCREDCPFVHKNQEQLYDSLIPHLAKVED